MENAVELELEQLRRQKATIEQRIRALTTLTSIHDNVKLDIVKSKGPQCGKWAVSYKYQHIRWHGNEARYRQGEKWIPLFCCNTRKEAVEKLATVIDDFRVLYDEIESQYEQEG